MTYHVYHEEWLAMRCSQRGLVTRTSGDGVNTSILSEILYDHPHCFLPPGEWTNLVKVTKLMKDFALACIPKTNFPGVDVCLFDLCMCLDYGVEMDIRLANTSQASIVVLFVPNANECHATKKFIQKLFLKELVAGEESKENRLPSRKRKKRQTQREARDKLVDMEEEHVNIVAQKHLLMFVHALMQCEVDEIISSMSVGFHEFEQKFEVVCALSFSPPKSLPNTGNKEFSYF
jgi:hypothetical protein